MATYTIREHPKLSGVYIVELLPFRGETFAVPVSRDDRGNPIYSQREAPLNYHEWRVEALGFAEGWYLADADLIPLDWTWKGKIRTPASDGPANARLKREAHVYDVRPGDPYEHHEAALIWAARGDAEDARDAFEEALGIRYKIRPVNMIGETLTS